MVYSKSLNKYEIRFLGGHANTDQIANQYTIDNNNSAFFYTADQRQNFSVSTPYDCNVALIATYNNVDQVVLKEVRYWTGSGWEWRISNTYTPKV